jgi:molecular chaperone GrpE
MMSDEERQGPVIRDRRRIDPATGQVREPREPGPQQRGPGQAGAQPRPGRHSVSQPGGRGTGGNAGPGSQRGGQGAGGSAAPGGPPPGGARPGDGPFTSTTTSPEAWPAGEAPVGPGSGPGGPESGGHESGDAASGQPAAAAAETAAKLAERTADLQRLQAEYANYRKRVERDRVAVREQALANVLNELLPVLDDIGRAREHGELTGGFKSVADSLEGVMVKLGLTPFGENGDPFDPTLHEALMHSYSPDVTETTCVQILQPGYKVGERIIRPARVSVAEPAEAASGDSGQPGAGAPPTAPDDGDADAAPHGDT